MLPKGHSLSRVVRKCPVSILQLGGLGMKDRRGVRPLAENKDESLGHGVKLKEK